MHLPLFHKVYLVAFQGGVGALNTNAFHILTDVQKATSFTEHVAARNERH